LTRLLSIIIECRVVNNAYSEKRHSCRGHDNETLLGSYRLRTKTFETRVAANTSNRYYVLPRVFNVKRANRKRYDVRRHICVRFSRRQHRLRGHVVTSNTTLRCDRFRSERFLKRVLGAYSRIVTRVPHGVLKCGRIVSPQNVVTPRATQIVTAKETKTTSQSDINYNARIYYCVLYSRKFIRRCFIMCADKFPVNPDLQYIIADQLRKKKKRKK